MRSELNLRFYSILLVTDQLFLFSCSSIGDHEWPVGKANQDCQQKKHGGCKADQLPLKEAATKARGAIGRRMRGCAYWGRGLSGNAIERITSSQDELITDDGWCGHADLLARELVGVQQFELAAGSDDKGFAELVKAIDLSVRRPGGTRKRSSVSQALTLIDRLAGESIE